MGATGRDHGDEPARLGPRATLARDTILERIEHGIYPANEKLPGERDLAASIGVSRMVLRDALSALARQGYLENSPWRGWFVRGHEAGDRVVLSSFTEMARGRGLVAGARVVAQRVRACSLSEADALGLGPAASVLELVRVRSLSGVPTCRDVSVLPLSRVGALAEVCFEDASLYVELERVAGIRIVRSDYRMHAAAADAQIAELLGVGVGTPVLVGEEVAHDIAGAPVLLGQVTYRGDAYRFEATLYRKA